MCPFLGLRVIACGVESEELRNYLKAENCDSIQGFIFSHPVSASDLQNWLQSGQQALFSKDNIAVNQQKLSLG